jgi:hypothetical protein
VTEGEFPALADRIVYKAASSNSPGLHLATPATPTPFLTLSPNSNVQLANWPLTPDGRYVAWGLDDGTVMTADLTAIHDTLGQVGLEWEKTP